MATIEGEWESSAQSPMGAQTSILLFTASGNGGFTGTSTGPMGVMEIVDGTETADGIAFAMKLTKPFPMTLKAAATVTGDTMAGEIDTGAFGKMPFTAVRKG